MRKSKSYFIILILLSAIFLSGCVSTQMKALETSGSQVALRSIQTRAFDTTDKKLMMQTVISTMQDLDFVIDDADLLLGSVTGTKFLGYTSVKMTVIVRPREKTQLLVRAGARYGIKQVDDAETYQDFFNALEKAIFLTAHQVD